MDVVGGKVVAIVVLTVVGTVEGTSVVRVVGAS